MIQTLRKRLNRKDEGFTLIELMVVVLIIAILLAIAIPTFLGARGRAENRAAESTVRNALTAEKTVYTDSQAYTDTVATLSGIEPSLSWNSGAAPATWTSNSIVALSKDSGNEICLTAKSNSGNYYGVIDIAQTDTTFTTAGTFYFKPSGALTAAAGCAGAAADTSGAATTPSGASW